MLAEVNARARLRVLALVALWTTPRRYFKRRYGQHVHTERTWRTTYETVEVYDVDRCAGCQGVLAYPHTIKGHQPCSCVPGGHRSWYCFDCLTWTYDPPCTDPVRGMGSSYG